METKMCTLSGRRVRLLLLGGIAALSSCSSGTPARTVRASDLGRGTAESLRPPLVIQFERGDTLPLQLGLEGDLFESRGQPQEVTVKRRFWLRMDDDLRVSLDGRTWQSVDDVPGELRVGWGGDGARPSMSVLLRTLAR